mmetsp:Transcript_7696/g.22351  ORF Transcript_7696/g.22351 Transcript_7696/m.22351 type:complete len:354 (+) Transcript_7696:3-1064(+)
MIETQGRRTVLQSHSSSNSHLIQDRFHSIPPENMARTRSSAKSVDDDDKYNPQSHKQKKQDDPSASASLLKQKNRGFISTAATKANKVTKFTDDDLIELEKHNENEKEVVVSNNDNIQNDDDDDDDDDAIEEVTTSDARTKLLLQQEEAQKQNVLLKQTKKKKKKKKNKTTVDDDMDDDFFNQLDTLRREEELNKQQQQQADDIMKKHNSSNKKKQGKHTTFVAIDEENAAMMKHPNGTKINDNINVVVLPDGRPGQTTASTAAPAFFTKVSEQALLYSRRNILDGSDGMRVSPYTKKKVPTRKRDTVVKWKRSKKATNMSKFHGSGRKSIKGGGLPAVAFAVGGSERRKSTY